MIVWLPTVAPWFTAVTPSVFVMLRSAVGTTVVTSPALVLLPALPAGSPPPLTLAEFVTLGAAAAPTPAVSVIALVPPLAAMDVALVQVTSWPTAEQLHPTPVPETNVSPAGRLSVTVTVPAVAARPLLVTVSV